MFSIMLHNYFNLNLNIMKTSSTPQQPLNTNNFKTEMSKMFEPFKEKIVEASNHFRQNYEAYKKTNKNKTSALEDQVQPTGHQKTPSLFSDYSAQQTPMEKTGRNTPVESKLRNSYDLCEWDSSKMNGFKDLQTIHKFYHEVFSQKKLMGKKSNSYDFKMDEKAILMRLFHQLKDEENYVSFTEITDFFKSCRLYYLCYNIKPSKLQDILKDSAHEYQDRLTQAQFLNLFYIDRPNITAYDQNEEARVMKRCIISQESWKDLKTIFSTLDTFGDETIYLAPFIYKVKNNYSNRSLINQPAIEYPEIKRTISIKKVIFNIEHRSLMQQKIRWKDIQAIFNNYEHSSSPTIDILYKNMIERGQITKFTNYFQLSSSILQEIQNIYSRCPKYCQAFVKTKFICKQLLDSNALKPQLKEAIVRIVTNGIHSRSVRLQDQIRLLMQEAEEYIDMDELLEYFSIKGPINTIPDIIDPFSLEESSEEDNQTRLRSLDKAKSLQKLKDINASKKGYKAVRHLTVCYEFKLSQKKRETVMQSKTRKMRQEKEQQLQRELMKQFKANPIPADLNPQRYKAFIKKMEQQKEMKRQQNRKKKEQEVKVYQYLKTNTLLFNKKSAPKQEINKSTTKFSSKPIPWFVGEVYMLDRINDSKHLRRKALNVQSKKQVLKHWKDLPDVARNSIDQSIEFMQTNNEKAKRSYPLKVKEVPNFKELQLQFAESLQKRKQNLQVTEPKEFNLSYHRSPPKRLIEDKKAQKTLKRKYSAPVIIPPQKVDIPMTLKYQNMINFTKQRLNQQQEQKKRQIQAQKERKQKQRNFAKFMRRKFKDTMRKSQSLHKAAENKFKKHQQHWKELRKQNEEDLCRIYFNVMSKPFLFQQQGSNPKSSKVPTLKKKNRKNHQQSNHQTSKHIHQSPLKAIEAENYDEATEKKGFSPSHEPDSQEQSSPPYLNQSF